MKLIVIVIALAACGQSAKQNELIGQVKKVIDKTPLICPDHTIVDISLGVLRNGVGSMSREDVELYVPAEADVKLLKRAAETGQVVKAIYDVQRVGICRPDHWLTHAEVIADVEAK